MATYIHNNFKNRLNGCSGGYISNISNRPKVTLANGSEVTMNSDHTLAISIIYLYSPTSSVQNKIGCAYLSSSDAVLTNEYTCPDLLTNITSTSQSATWTYNSKSGKTTGTWIITNNAETAQTVRKIAVYFSTSTGDINSSPSSYSLQFVTDLDSPVTIPAGETGIVSFTLDFNNI